jgi:hypothetical protein
MNKYGAVAGIHLFRYDAVPQGQRLNFEDSSLNTKKENKSTHIISFPQRRVGFTCLGMMPILKVRN